MNKLIVFVCLFLIGAGGTYGCLYFRRKMTARTTEDSCQKHKLEACPFCDESLVEKLGWCSEHKVPEALCYQCRPELVPAFKIEGDWCRGHSVPESQCVSCGGGTVVRKDGKVLCSKHGITESLCPFCDASLVEKMGVCHGHNVPEALCSRCNKDLVAGFKAEGDWCSEHSLPESQCKVCGAK